MVRDQTPRQRKQFSSLHCQNPCLEFSPLTLLSRALFFLSEGLRDQHTLQHFVSHTLRHLIQHKVQHFIRHTLIQQPLQHLNRHTLHPTLQYLNGDVSYTPKKLLMRKKILRCLLYPVNQLHTTPTSITEHYPAVLVLPQ